MHLKTVAVLRFGDTVEEAEVEGDLGGDESQWVVSNVRRTDGERLLGKEKQQAEEALFFSRWPEALEGA